MFENIQQRSAFAEIQGFLATTRNILELSEKQDFDAHA